MRTIETRHVACELTRWIGAEARVHAYCPALSRMLIRLSLRGVEELATVILVSAQHYCGPLRWVVQEPKVIENDGTVIGLADSLAKVQIETDVAGMMVGTDSESEEFFAHFHWRGDA